MRLSGVLALAGLACLTATDAVAQPTGVPPWTPPAEAFPSAAPPPPRGPVYPGAPEAWDAPPPPPPPNVSGAEGDASPSMAGLLAVVSTLVPVGIGFTTMALAERDEGEAAVAGIAIVGTGVVFGPSVGHFYAGEVGHGFGTAGLRLLATGNAAGLGIFGALFMWSSREPVIGAVLFGAAGLSGAAGFGLVLYDLVDAPSAARRANREDQSARTQPAGVPDITFGPAGGSLTWTF